MKNLFCVVMAGLATALPCWSQVIVERGPHHNIIRTVEIEEVDGQTVLHTNDVTQLSTGLNYWDEQQNAWIPSSNEIEILNSGAVYRKGQFKLLFASNINDPNGNLEWFPTPNERIVIQTIGIAMREIATGNSVFIAQIKDTQGFLTAPNQITYPACFDNIDADIRLSVNPLGSGFENDVILHERAPDPAAFGFEGECRLEVWHEILTSPIPQLQTTVIQRTADRIDTDTQLRFGSMTISPGTAFLIGADADELKGNAGIPVPVAKQYVVDPATQMRFLVESVPLVDIAPQLQRLPPSKGALKLNEDDKKMLVASWGKKDKGLRPAVLVKRKPAGEKLVAAISRKEVPPSKGLLLDFPALANQTNFTFRGDTTYYIGTNSIVNLDGLTVIEPACVIKFDGYNSVNGTPVINIKGPLDCQTLPYAPCVITSCEDRTVGHTNTALYASISAIPYGAYHLKFPSDNTNSIKIHDIRSRFAQNAFGFLSSGNVEAWNIQVYSAFGDVFQGAANAITLRNVLVHKANNVAVATGNNTLFKGEHLTVHSGSKTFYAASHTGCSFSLTNSLLVVVTNSSSSGLTTVSSDSLPSASGVFEEVGRGAHYLADDRYRNSGSTNISTNLTQGVFKYSTTYPPVVLANNFTINTTLGPQAPRDVDFPDRGYHYPALDWAIGNISVATGVTLTLTNGAALAGFDVNALTLEGTSQFICEGRPLNLNRFIRYNTVQEQPVDWGSVGAIMRLVKVSAASLVKVRFTEAAHLAYSPASGRSTFIHNTGMELPNSITVRDNEIYSSNLSLLHHSAYTSPTANVLNNLLHRTGISFNSQYSMNVNAKNNLFRYGSVAFSYHNAGTWTVNNNLFDHCTAYSLYNPFENLNNAYETNGVPISGSDSNKWVIVFDYQPGAQGRWYYPTSGGNLSSLVNGGNESAATAGLFHFTTRTDHTKDTSSVDIGFHYPSIDANGAIDTDADGLSDYLEDTNGNGAVNTGESNYAISVRITSPSRSVSLP